MTPNALCEKDEKTNASFPEEEKKDVRDA